MSLDKRWFHLIWITIALLGWVRTVSAYEWCIDNVPERHEFLSDGSVKGPTVDFIQTVFKRANLPLTLSPNTPFPRCLKRMQTGQSQIMMSLNYSAERERYMHLIPVYPARAEVLFMRKDTSIVPTALNGIKSNRIAIIRDTKLNTSALPLLTPHNELLEVDSAEDGLIWLLMQHIDILLAPRYITTAILKSNTRYDLNIQRLGLELPLGVKQQVHLGIARHADINQAELDKLRAIVDEMRQTGEAEALLFPDDANFTHSN